MNWWTPNNNFLTNQLEIFGLDFLEHTHTDRCTFTAYEYTLIFTFLIFCLPNKLFLT